MRLGLIGLGRIGAFHADTLTSLPAVDSLVVTDAVPAVTKAVAEKVDAQAADSPDAVLAAGVDGLVVAAATDAHPALLTAAVDAGVPVFCEKPIGGSLAESLRTVERLQDAGTPVQIGYQRRFDAGYTAARAAVQSGELGRLSLVRSTTHDPAPPPAAYIAVSGGFFRDCGVHDFDIVSWVTGLDVAEVTAIGSTNGEAFFAEAGDVDTFAAVLTLTDGTLAVVTNTRYNGRGYDVRLELHGVADSIGVGLEDRLPLRSVEPGTTFPAGEPYPAFLQRFLPAYRAELESFTEVVAGTRPSPCTLADAMQAEWVAQACDISWRDRRAVRVDEAREGVR